MKILLVAVGLFLLGAEPAVAEVLDKTADVDGVAVHYKVVLPRDYDPSRAYPAVLAFGGGGQTMDVIESMIGTQFQQEAEKRGYIVISPAAPNGELFVFVDGEKVIPGLVAKVLADYKIQDGKFHIAGRSNGGISAFHLAALYPQYFVSITAFPGFLTELTPSRLKGISTMCIYMHVGELDTDWRGQMTDQAEFFREQGMRLQFTVEEGQAHSIDTLTGPGSAHLFDHFDEARRGCGK
jgi:poly(3-hydroxybutyrate) depolymerase